MAKDSDVIKELKTLGLELVDAVDQMRRSKEFKDIERELATSVKSISKTLAAGFSAAKSSESTARLKTQVKKVVHVGKVVGKEEARRAQSSAARNLRRITVALKKFNRRFGKKTTD